MGCPPEIAAILLKILGQGTLRIRAYGWKKDAEACAVEADHLHNLPALLSDFDSERLKFYWNVERPMFVQRARSADEFEPMWRELERHVSELAIA